MFFDFLQTFNTKRRYIAYFCLLFNAYNEMCARFGVSIAMISGMVKTDCNDPQDTGSFCWTEKVQALVLGAYFYGHTVQFVTVYVARRFTRFTITYRFWLVITIVLQLSYPNIAAASTTFLIASQVFRGFVAAIMVTYHLDYISRFSVGSEGKVLISLVGAIHYVGQGTGGLIAGIMCDRFGWRYYFYYEGACFIIGLALTLTFVPDLLHKSWYLTTKEKDLIVKHNSTLNGPHIPQEQSAGNESPQSRLSIRSVISRVYLISFCIYAHAYTLVYYNSLSVVPFFLKKVLGADPLIISYLNVVLTLLIAFCTMIMSYFFQRLDRILSWLMCRMVFAVVPMMLQLVFLVGLSTITSINTGIFILTLSAIAASTLYSGSIYTINYEIDPKNSPLFVSIFNSFGQAAGFLGPMLMAAITTTDPEIPDYNSVYKQRWNYFFYTVAGVAAAGCVAIVGAYLVKPGEWVNRTGSISE
ncbi:hypothetical protein ACHWQZ_G006380 [Mnemiopsis leidyi]